MVALNVAMFASALVVGGHYLVDLPAGTAVAVASIAFGRAATRRGQPVGHSDHHSHVRRGAGEPI